MRKKLGYKQKYERYNREFKFIPYATKMKLVIMKYGVYG